MAGDFLPWDPSGQQNPDALNVWNKGCPVGYFCEFVSPTFVAPDGTLPVDYGNPVSRAICRLAATTTPDTVVQESGTTWTDTLNNFNDAITKTLQQASSGIFQGIGAMLPLLVLAVMAIFLINSRQR